MVAVPVFFSVGEKLYNLASFYNQVAHVVDKATFCGSGYSFLRGEHKHVPIGFFICSATCSRPIKPYFCLRVNLKHILFNPLHHGFVCHG